MSEAGHIKAAKDNLAIKKRFFAALAQIVLKEKDWRGIRAFARVYEINPGNFYQLRVKDNFTVEPAYLAWIVEDYNVSASWLLTGQGEMFVKAR